MAHSACVAPTTPTPKQVVSLISHTSRFNFSYLPSLIIPKVMIKLWPSDTLVTPKPSPGAGGPQEKNPFDGTTTPTPSTPTIHHPLLNPSSHSHYFPSTSPATSPNSPAGAIHPDQSSPTPASTLGSSPSALPTTKLTINAPEFKMQQPPPSSSKTATSMPSVAPSSLAPATITTSTSINSSTSSSPQPAASRGQIHVKLIQARALNVHSPEARPYVVVQFEQNEFVSREPTDESDREVKGTPSRPSNAVSVLGAINAKAAALDTSKRGKNSTNPSPPSSIGSRQSSTISVASSSGAPTGLFSRLSAHNPVWKHEVSL